MDDKYKMVRVNILDQIYHRGQGKAETALNVVLKPLSVALGGRTIVLEEGRAEPKIHKVNHIGLRFLACIGSLVLFPIMLTGLGLKFFLIYKSQTELLKNHEKSCRQDEEVQGSEEEDITSIEILDSKEEIKLTSVQQQLKDEIDAVKKFDTKLPAKPEPGTWRSYGKNELGESDQSFEQFVKPTWRVPDDLEDPPVVVIQLIGNLTETDQNILKIASEWLSVFHQIEVKFEEKALSVEELQKLSAFKQEPDTKEGAYGNQYKADHLIDRLRGAQYKKHYDKHGEKAYIIGFTDHDLYAFQILFGQAAETSPHGLDFHPVEVCMQVQKRKDFAIDVYAGSCHNFVYGAACYGGPGVFSNARFGNPKKDFDLCLARTIKILTHEFGHMRWLPHCHGYDCNIGGYMNMKEVDKRPYLFCAKDMAKICYLTNSKLSDQYKRIRDMMTTFNEKHGVSLEFKKELNFLNKAVKELSV